jgi:putative membrane protein
MKTALSLIFKGIAMGAANVIPGVSGGTIALITGIFERLINAIKSLNFKAVSMLLKGRFNDFARHTDLLFLIYVFAGVGIAIFTLARLFEFLFEAYPVYIWSYFFGLILASVYFVGRSIERWNTAAWISFLAGAALAIAITFLSPATENRNFFYLILCGVVAVSSMILPGLSGSFVLILMGNYQLVAIEAINNLDLTILAPVLIGMVGGLIAFSHFLSWLLKSYKNQTIAVLTGFIFGSLGIIWPWKKAVYMLAEGGEPMVKEGKMIVERYIMTLPESWGLEQLIAIALILAGIASIWLIELTAKKQS